MQQSSRQEPCRDHVHSARNDDYSELVRLYWSRIYKACFRITRDHLDAEDAAQDAFLRAYSNRHQFEGRAQFSTWLTRIAVNSSLMILRRKRNRRELSADGGDPEKDGHFPFDASDNRPDQLTLVIYSEKRDLLLKSIAALPPKLRCVAELMLLNEHTSEEACQILNISVPSLKARLYRARRRMQARGRWIA